MSRHRSGLLTAAPKSIRRHRLFGPVLGLKFADELGYDNFGILESLRELAVLGRRLIEAFGTYLCFALFPDVCSPHRSNAWSRQGRGEAA